MARCLEYWNTGFNLGVTISTKWYAQTFITSAAQSVESVRILLSKSNGFAQYGTITVSLRATDENGYPTGSDLCTGTTDGSTLPNFSTTEWRFFTFSSPCNLTTNTRYAIVLKADVDSHVLLCVKNPNAATVSKLQQSSNNISWSDFSSSVNLLFEVYASDGIINFEYSINTSIGMAATCDRAVTNSRSISTCAGLLTSLSREEGVGELLCVSSRDSGSIKTSDGTTWTTCAIDGSSNILPWAYFSVFENRLCALNNRYRGFAYSAPNDLKTAWTDEANFPNLPLSFNGIFAGRDASDDPALFLLTAKGMYQLDVFTNMVYAPTEASWEIDGNSGKKGLYFRGSNYLAVNKGIYQVKDGDALPVGPDMDDGLPEDMQGIITDMIGVGFWLVIAVDGGASKKSCILKRYITGDHWHTVYVGSLNTPIRALCWDSDTLYFGEGNNVKSLPLPNVMANAKQQSTIDYCADGHIIYPHFSSEFEAMPKVAHTVRAVTKDCNASEKITVYYRIDDDTDWTLLGNFNTSPRPTALNFGTSGIEFESIQLKAVFERGATTTNSPKLESITLEYRPIPPTLWGWDFKAMAMTRGEVRGQDIIDALTTAMESKTLLSFYPTGNVDDTEYKVEVSGMPAAKKGTEFGQEGIFNVSVQEVID